MFTGDPDSRWTTTRGESQVGKSQVGESLVGESRVRESNNLRIISCPFLFSVG